MLRKGCNKNRHRNPNPNYLQIVNGNASFTSAGSQIDGSLCDHGGHQCSHERYQQGAKADNHYEWQQPRIVWFAIKIVRKAEQNWIRKRVGTRPFELTFPCIPNRARHVPWYHPSKIGFWICWKSFPLFAQHSWMDSTRGKRLRWKLEWWNTRGEDIGPCPAVLASCSWRLSMGTKWKVFQK